MFYRLVRSLGFGAFIGILINLFERYKGYNNLTFFVGLIVVALALLFINTSSKMNYSLTLPDAHWTNFKSKIKDSKNNNASVGLIVIGICILIVGVIFYS